MDAKIHVVSDFALRGLSVFEGVRAYASAISQGHHLIEWEAHLRRLKRSAQVMRFPDVTRNLESLDAGMKQLVERLPDGEDAYLRPTIFVESGAYEVDPEKIIVGEFIAARRVESGTRPPISAEISRWRHLPGDSFPYEAKVGAIYTLLRMSRLDALAHGADESILINHHGRVTESGGASVFALMNGVLRTPPLSDGVLDSITRRIVVRIATDMGMTVIESHLDAEALCSAQEVFLAGTLDEVLPVARLSHRDRVHTFGTSCSEAIRERYLRLCRSGMLNESLPARAAD